MFKNLQYIYKSDNLSIWKSVFNHQCLCIMTKKYKLNICTYNNTGEISSHQCNSVDAILYYNLLSHKKIKSINYNLFPNLDIQEINEELIINKINSLIIFS